MQSLRIGLRLAFLAVAICLIPVILAGCVGSFTLPGPRPTTIDISGVVFSSDGSPLSGAQIEINQRTTTTGPDGTYALAGVNVPDGRAWYTVSASDHVARSGSVPVAKGTQLQLDFTLHRPSQIGNGTVTGTMNFVAQPFNGQQSCQVDYSTAWETHNRWMSLFSDIDLTPTEVIVDIIGTPSEELAERLAHETGASSYRVSDLIDRIMLGIPAGVDTDTFIDIVRSQPEVTDAHPNSVIVNTSVPPATYAMPPNDECYYAQFHLPQIQAPWAWTVTTGSRSVVVAVVDTGVIPDHPDLIDNLIPGWDFVDNDDTLYDEVGHGTHVAGILGAVSNNGRFVTGVAHEVSIMPIRSFYLISTTLERLVAGVRYAGDQGVDILNASFGSTLDLPLLREAFEYVQSTGAIVVAAVGNSGPGPDTVMQPATWDGIIGVGALSLHRTEIGDFSARGEGVDIVAPGEEILSLNATGSLVPATGTSMATPMVSGVIALMLANGIPKDQVEEILYRTAVRIGDPENNPEDRHTYGWGILNAYAAVLGLDPVDTVIFVVNHRGEVVSSVTSPDTSRRFTVTDVPEGEDLTLVGWIDVNENGLIDIGDYFGTIPFSVEEDGTVSVELLLDVYDQEQPLMYDVVF